MKLSYSIQKLCNTLIDSGARPIIVGGYVRDFFMDKVSKDIDIEVYNISSLEKLKSNLELLGSVHEVGKSFGVLKIHLEEYDFDISLPRTEIKTAKGHKGFHIQTNGYLDFITAARRRDFTMNAIGYDVVTSSVIDPYNGQEDIANSIIRHVNDESFVEDPLRVLRAAQFAARFDFKLDTNTLKLCQNMVKQKMLNELPKERVFEEYKKLLLKANKPSIGFELLDELGALFPELKALQGVIQDERYHPEGDVWTHTMMSLDAMAELKTGDNRRDLILLLAVLCHDLGKAETTEIIEEKVTAIAHETMLKPTISLLDRLSNEKELHQEIQTLVKTHLMPSQLYKQNSKDSAIKRLSTRVNIEDLIILAKADHFGRTTEEAKKREYPAGEWLLTKAQELNVQNEKPKALLQGRDLINRGMKAGPYFKKILDDAYEAQLEGEFYTHKEALIWLDNYFSLLF
jgi:tRNA nucleotidyltransferase (CCA-adding enzyme)